MSPLSTFITVFIYYLAIVLILWGVAIASLYIIGKLGLTVTGAVGIDTGLALGLLRTEIGHALIPIAHPAVIIFNIIAALALAGQCARSCYLRWHNGTPAVGVALVAALMFLVWADVLENSYIFMAIIVLAPFAALSFGDVIFREKRPKGDPFKVNKYEGIIDLDSMEFDDDEYALGANTPGESPDSLSLLQQYGRTAGIDKSKGFKRFSPGRLRRRYMPLGINLEKVNSFFGVCVSIGIAEHLIFYAKYILQLNEIKSRIKGITIDSDMRMPYFWDLQDHTYYGYIVAILLVLFIQAYWNYEYYNKKTKSIYVMKRLPDRREYPMTIWVGPAIQALTIALIMVAHTAIDLILYAVATPEVALYPDYLSHILPF